MEHNIKAINHYEMATLSEDEQSELNSLLSLSRADNTTKLYNTAVLKFMRWGGYIPTTSSVLLKFILFMKNNNKASTIATYITSISAAQKELGFDSPINSDINKVLKSLKKLDPRTTRKGEVITKTELLNTLTQLKESTSQSGIRNRFIFLLMLWSGCRTEEMPKFTFENTDCDNNSIKLYLYKAKGDQIGHGENIELPMIAAMKGLLCPVQAFINYKNILPIRTGSLIKRLNRNGELLHTSMSERSIGEVLKTCLITAGIDPKRATKINGHSFRHTLAENASEINLNSNTIQLLGRWKDPKSAQSYTGTKTNQAILEIANHISKTII
jgi:integrase